MGKIANSRNLHEKMLRDSYSLGLLKYKLRFQISLGTPNAKQL